MKTVFNSEYAFREEENAFLLEKLLHDSYDTAFIKIPL
jgi:hypothetical protein